MRVAPPIRLRIAFLCLATLLILLASSARAGTADDPTGDLLEGASGPDLTALSAAHQGDELVITLRTEGSLIAPDSGRSDALFGFVDLDTDRNADTGELALVDFLTGDVSGLGDEMFVDLSTFDGAQADLMGVGGARLGQVSMDLASRSVTLRVPHDLLGTEETVHTAAVVGDEATPSDRAPQTGFLASTGAVPEDAVLLKNDRFAVDVSWQDFTGAQGTGTLAVRSEDTGVFWFFSAANWELMVKVVDGCTLNDRFWVFAAATTNVEYTLRLTDTQTGSVKTYFNPLGNAAAAITDNAAFATCP